MGSPPDSDVERLKSAAVFFGELEAEAEKIQQGEFDLLLEAVDQLPEHEKQYTAVLFAKHQPEKCRRVVFLLAARWGVLKIAKTIGCSHHTVSAVRRTMAEKVAIAEARLGEIGEDVLLQQLQRLRDNPEALDIDKIPMAVAMIADKLPALRGSGPAPQQHLHVHLAATDVNSLIEQARRQQGSQTGLEGVGAFPMGGALPAPGAGLVPTLGPILDTAFEVVQASGPVAGDMKCTALPHHNREETESDTGNDTDGGTKAPGAGERDPDPDRGGGGSSGSAGGPSGDALPPL